MKTKTRVAGVIGSGSEPHTSLSFPLGKWLAENEFHLINGGGQGVMAEAAKGFTSVKDRKGLVVGVIPSSLPCETSEDHQKYRPAESYPNSYVDLPIYTHLHLSGAEGKNIASRNHIIVLSSDVLIALPGGAGTKSEIELALQYGKPLVIISPDGEWKEFLESAARFAKSVEEAAPHIRKILRKKP